MDIDIQREWFPDACKMVRTSSTSASDAAKNLTTYYPHALTKGIGVMQGAAIHDLTEAERQLEAAMRIVRKARAQAMAVPVQRLEAAE